MGSSWPELSSTTFTSFVTATAVCAAISAGRASSASPCPVCPARLSSWRLIRRPLPRRMKQETGAGRTKPGTINAAIVAFYQSYAFMKNKPITRSTDRNILEAFRIKHGDKHAATIERKHVEAIIAEKAGTPAAQRNLLRVLRVLLAFAVEQGLRKDNPALGIKLKALDTSGFHSWTEEEVRLFEERHPIGTKARLALALLLYTAQRRQDVVNLGPG